MPENRMRGLGLGFPGEHVEQRRKHHQHPSRRRRKSGKGALVAAEGKKSPESVVSFSRNNNNDSNNYFVGSNPFFASAAADNCHLGSDRDSPNLSFHLVGRGCCISQDPDPEKRRASFDINIQHTSKEVDQEVGTREEEEERKEEITVLDPSKHSFSLALRECQNRRFRSEGISLAVEERKQRRRRPASLDLNNHMSDTSVSSPRSFVAGGGLKKSSAVSVRSRSGMFPSPGTPNYRHGGGAAGYQKGWSSERVPLPGNAGRRFGSSAALLPLGNGKALPSKWEDAEKWICSPVSGDGVGIRQSGLPPHHRRPKSKSGPLGTAGGIRGCYAAASPSLPGFDGGRTRNFTVNSPFTAGVLVADRGCCGGSSERGETDGGCGEGEGRSHSAQSDHGMMRSASVHGWSELLLESSSSLPSSQDGKPGSTEDGSTTISSVILRKDMATQMSPDNSTHSSSKGHQQPSSPPHSSLTFGELHSHFSKLEVRDVQIDDRVTVTRWSKKHIARGLDKNSANITQWRKKIVEVQPSLWEVAEPAKCMSKSKREEAKITAWENLQKAKAEAAISKLEMKLEKKRSSTMDRILNKLRSSQKKAQEMRKTVAASQMHQIVSTTKKPSVFCKTRYIGSFGGCFRCQAF